jgi:hypothetical protein
MIDKQVQFLMAVLLAGESCSVSQLSALNHTSGMFLSCRRWLTHSREGSRTLWCVNAEGKELIRRYHETKTEGP